MKIKNLEECEALAGEILRNIELSEIPINNVILKGLRLCRLMGDDIGIDFFSFEASGYPRDNQGYITPRAWEICKLAGRIYVDSDKDDKKQEFGEEDMRRWWREKDFSSVFNEKIITSDIDADSIVEMIYIDSANEG